MTLNVSLLGAISGLKAAQTGIDLVSRNVANASVDGYTRKTLVQETLVLNGQARGVLANEIIRQVDGDLQRQLNSETSTAASFIVRNDFLSRLETFFGQPEDGRSVSGRLSTLNNTFSELAATPDGAAQQTAAIRAAEDFAYDMNRLGDELNRLRQQAESGIENSVNEINTKLEQISDLNRRVIAERSVNSEAVDLLDQRDELVNQLSDLIDITYFESEGGILNISTSNGRALVDKSVHPIQFEDQVVTPTSFYSNPTLYPVAPPALGGIVVDGVDIAGDVRGGKLHGYLQLRDEILPQAQAQLDELSMVVLQEFRDQDLLLFVDNALPAPASPIAAGAYVYPPVAGDEVGLSGRLAINQNIISEQWRLRDGTSAAAESANRADGTLLNSIIDNVFDAQQTFRTGGLGGSGGLNSGLEASGTLQRYASSFISFQAVQKATTQDSVEYEAILTEALDRRVTGESGVNLDEEMAQMVILQNAYSASARSIQTLQEMLDELMNLIR